MERIKHIINSLYFGSNQPSPFTSDQIFNSFKQGRVNLPLLRRLGGGGNCASIALIKAAIATFGFDNIFKSVIIDENNRRFLIDLKDDEQKVYWLSFKDFEFGAEKSAFELNSNDPVSVDIYEFARFCFAVMAEIKRWTYRVNKSYKRAVTDFNKGESTAYIHEYLGLTATKIPDLSIANLSSKKNLILWNAPHAVFSSEGLYDEFFEKHDGVKLEGIQSLAKLQDIHGDGTSDYAPIGANVFLQGIPS